jgi:hypothetical protein
MVRPVLFSNEFTWHVYPNPSGGHYNFSFQAAPGEMISVRVHDLSGKTIMQTTDRADGFVQKISISLEDPKYAKGLYLLEVKGEVKQQTFQLLKQ